MKACTLSAEPLSSPPHQAPYYSDLRQETHTSCHVDHQHYWLIYILTYWDYLRLFSGASLRGSVVKKNLFAIQEMQVQSLGWEYPLEKGMATHSSILPWRIPGTEEPGGLQSMGSESQTQLSD